MLKKQQQLEESLIQRPTAAVPQITSNYFLKTQPKLSNMQKYIIITILSVLMMISLAWSSLLSRRLEIDTPQLVQASAFFVSSFCFFAIFKPTTEKTLKQILLPKCLRTRQMVASLFVSIGIMLMV